MKTATPGPLVHLYETALPLEIAEPELGPNQLFSIETESLVVAEAAVVRIVSVADAEEAAVVAIVVLAGSLGP
jgi:hypothetical protein